MSKISVFGHVLFATMLFALPLPVAADSSGGATIEVQPSLMRWEFHNKALRVGVKVQNETNKPLEYVFFECVGYAANNEPVIIGTGAAENIQPFKTVYTDTLFYGFSSKPTTTDCRITDTFFVHQ